MSSQEEWFDTKTTGRARSAQPGGAADLAQPDAEQQADARARTSARTPLSAAPARAAGPPGSSTAINVQARISTLRRTARSLRRMRRSRSSSGGALSGGGAERALRPCGFSRRGCVLHDRPTYRPSPCRHNVMPMTLSEARRLQQGRRRLPGARVDGQEANANPIPAADRGLTRMRRLPSAHAHARAFALAAEPTARAADPQPYTVTIAKTGNAPLDAALDRQLQPREPAREGAGRALRAGDARAGRRRPAADRAATASATTTAACRSASPAGRSTILACPTSCIDLPGTASVPVTVGDHHRAALPPAQGGDRRAPCRRTRRAALAPLAPGAPAVAATCWRRRDGSRTSCSRTATPSPR